MVFPPFIDGYPMIFLKILDRSGKTIARMTTSGLGGRPAESAVVVDLCRFVFLGSRMMNHQNMSG